MHRWPAGTPGRKQPDIERIWQWWYGRERFRSATFSWWRSGPSFHQRAGRAESTPRPDALDWPPLGSLWRTDPGLQENGKCDQISQWLNSLEDLSIKKATPFTQLECTGQSSDDSDRVGRVCAELVKRREESVSFVLQLNTGDKNYFSQTS